MTELELYHHGIKGQRWGVRRYQDENGKLTRLGKQHLKDTKINKKIDEYIKTGKAYIDNLPSYTVSGLSTMTLSTGEKLLSGLIHGHDFDWQEVTNYDDGYMSPARVIKNNPKAHMFGDDENISKFHKRGELTWDDMRDCNPGFGKPGTTQNCAKCSAALELRLRGYGISAGRQSYPSSDDAQSFWFKGAKRVDYDADFAEDALRSYGKKTSGTLSIRYPNGNGGHAMHWSNTEDGSFNIEDGQNGRVFHSIKEMMKEYGADFGGGVSTFRLDNCEPDWDAMEQDSVIRRANRYSKVKNKFSNKIVDTW